MPSKQDYTTVVKALASPSTDPARASSFWGVPGADLPSPSPSVPSLVRYSITSSTVASKQVQKQVFFPLALVETKGLAAEKGLFCPDSSWLRGVCSCPSFTRRWVSIPCKRRTCLVCGKVRKRKIASRIALGIELLGGADGAGWFVGTFDSDVSKAEAVAISQGLDQWIRRYFKKHFGVKPEIAKTWELHESGRLHLNMIIAPWRYVRQSDLSRQWKKLGGGTRVWITRVGASVGSEVAKVQGSGCVVLESPESGRRRLGNYIAKWDQMVLRGRGVSYSKGWPKLPDSQRSARKGNIQWEWFGNLTEETILHWYETQLGHWYETMVGESCSSDGEECDCFVFKESG